MKQKHSLSQGFYVGIGQSMETLHMNDISYYSLPNNIVILLMSKSRINPAVLKWFAGLKSCNFFVTQM